MMNGSPLIRDSILTTLFERDIYLSRIRQAPEFIKFMAEMKAQNEKYRREFG